MTIIHRSLGIPLVALVLVLCGAACAPGAAQDRPAASSQWATSSPQELVAQFERERGSPNGRASREIIRIFTDPASYPRSSVEALLDGLEQLALASADKRVRSAAASKVGMAGWAASKSPVPGVVARQVRIYRRASDPDVRARIVLSLASTAESDAAVAFLRTIALQSSRSGDFPNAPIEAIRALTFLGESGRVALRELHRGGWVRDREALGFLDQLSRSGYRPR